MESIQGLVEHIVYHNDTNGYTVFSLMCQGKGDCLCGKCHFAG